MAVKNSYQNYNKLLNKDYKDTFERIEIYVSTYMEDEFITDTILSEVLDLFISAQEDQLDIKDVIGDDLEVFAEKMIEEKKTSTLKKTLFSLKSYRFFAVVVFVMETLGLIIDFEEGNKTPWNGIFNVIDFIAIAIFSLIVGSFFNKIRQKIIFKYQWYTKKIDTILSITIFIFLFVAYFKISGDGIFNFNLPRYITIPSTFIFFIVMTILVRRKKKENKSNNNYITFGDVVYDENIIQYRKKYERYVRRCNKKQIQSQDVRTWYEKRYQKDYKWERYSKIIFIVFILAAMISQMFTSGFFDGLLFSAFLLAIEIPLYRALDKGRLGREKLYNEIKNKNTDIYDDSLFNQ